MIDATIADGDWLVPHSPVSMPIIADNVTILGTVVVPLGTVMAMLRRVRTDRAN